MKLSRWTFVFVFPALAACGQYHNPSDEVEIKRLQSDLATVRAQDATLESRLDAERADQALSSRAAAWQAVVDQRQAAAEQDKRDMLSERAVSAQERSALAAEEEAQTVGKAEAGRELDNTLNRR